MPAAAARTSPSQEALDIPPLPVRWNEGVGVTAHPMERVEEVHSEPGPLTYWRVHLPRALALELMLSPLTWGLASLSPF